MLHTWRIHSVSLALFHDFLHICFLWLGCPQLYHSIRSPGDWIAKHTMRISRWSDFPTSVLRGEFRIQCDNSFLLAGPGWSSIPGIGHSTGAWLQDLRLSLVKHKSPLGFWLLMILAISTETSCPFLCLWRDLTGLFDDLLLEKSLTGRFSSGRAYL